MQDEFPRSNCSLQHGYGFTHLRKQTADGQISSNVFSELYSFLRHLYWKHIHLNRNYQINVNPHKGVHTSPTRVLYIFDVEAYAHMCVRLYACLYVYRYAIIYTSVCLHFYVYLLIHIYAYLVFTFEVRHNVYIVSLRSTYIYKHKGNLLELNRSHGFSPVSYRSFFRDLSHLLLLLLREEEAIFFGAGSLQSHFFHSMPGVTLTLNP